jgi:hypothetical protein
MCNGRVELVDLGWLDPWVNGKVRLSHLGAPFRRVLYDVGERTGFWAESWFC